MLSKFYKYILFSIISLSIILPTTYYFSGFINDTDNYLLDIKYKFKEFFNQDSIKISKYILLVNNNDETRRKLNIASMELSKWVQYLKTLQSFDTATIALYLPLYFPETDSGATDDFINIIKSSENIILPGILDNNVQINSGLEDDSFLKIFHNLSNIETSNLKDFKYISLPHEKILKANPTIGFSNLFPDPDGIIRKIPMLATYDGKTVFSYTLATLIFFLNIDIQSIKIENNTLFLKSQKYDKELNIPLTENNEMYIQFFNNLNNKFLQAQFYDIYNSDKSLNLQNHVVINVDSASYGHQKYKTPIDPFMPGGLIVAAALNTIISEHFITPRTGKDMYFSLFFLSFLLVISALIFSPANKLIPFINKNSIFILFSFLVMFLYPLSTCIIFTYMKKELSTITPMLYILTFVLIASAYKMIIENRERKLLINTLRGFISGKKLDFLMTPHGSDLMLKTRKKEVSILLTDIVDFANWSTFHKPDFTFKTLKKYYNTIENIVFKNNGTIDKKMGDALLAFFGDLDENTDHARDALNAAIQIQIELKKHNFPFLTRIGVNSGNVTIGNLGTKQHLDYTVIGNAVNLTKRIEANCIPGGILIGPVAYNMLKDKEEFHLSPIEIELKEQEDYLTCYNVSFEV